jgi:hypothetical protein
MPQLKQLNMENIDMWRHPKYYKELRKAGNELAQASAVKEDLTGSSSSPARNKSDQAISSESGTPPNERATGPGLEVQIVYQDLRSLKQQATSNKPQAPSSDKKE